jgi:hypothetical protein
MPGGLVQVVAYGSQDLFLTSTPEITYFKTVYRRYTNFSFDTINIPFDNDVGFGMTSQVTIPKIGDLIHKMYLQINIPSVYLTRTTNQTDINNALASLNLAKNNYNIVLQFMKINSQAYRNAYNSYIAVNSNKNDIISNVQLTFQTLDNTGSITQAFNQVLENIDTIKTPINFNYNSINLNDLVIRSDVSIMTANELINLLKYGITQSTKVDNFFYIQILNAQNYYNDVINQNRRFAWVNKLGHSIIDYIEVTIGGTSIDKHYGRWIDIWYELTGNKNQQNIYNKMIGEIPELTTFDRLIKPSKTLFVPLQFWFNRNNGLALPLVSLEYHDVEIRVKMRNAQDISYTELQNDETYINIDDLFLDNGYNLNISLLVDFYYLDGPERKKFAQGSHEYLIEQVQVINDNNIISNIVQTNIDFFHSCKEILWITQKNSYTKNEDGINKCQWCNYSINNSNIGNPTINAELLFNGYNRIDKLDGNYFNYVQPNTYHTNTPSDGINSYSFSINPQEHQPAGTCNFSRLSNVLLKLYLDKMTLIESETVLGNLQNLYINKIQLSGVPTIDYIGQTIDISGGLYQYTIINYDDVNNIITIDTSGSTSIDDNIYIGLDYSINNGDDIGTINGLLFNQVVIESTSKNISDYYDNWNMKLGTNTYNVISYDNTKFLIEINDYINKYDIISGENYILTQPTVSTNANLYIFAINYNILRFISGMAGLAYV